MIRPGNKPEAKAILGIPNSSIFVLYLGRVSALKADLLPLLLAMAGDRPRVERNEVIFGVAGTFDHDGAGALRAAAKDLDLAEHVKLFDRVTDDRRLRLLQAADIFVSPSDSMQESFGLAPVEAMAAGVPQIVSDWDGYRETVVEGVTGFRIPTFWSRESASRACAGFLLGWEYDHLVASQSVAIDLVKWENALMKLAEDRCLRASMSAASRERADRYFSMQAVRREYHNLFCELMMRSGGAMRRKGERFQLENGRYHEVFGHYATETLRRETILSAGESRDHADAVTLAGRWPQLRTFPLIDGSIISYMLSIVIDNGPLRIQDVLDSLPPSCDVSKGMQHIMWAIKYGLLRVHRA